MGTRLIILGLRQGVTTDGAKHGTESGARWMALMERRARGRQIPRAQARDSGPAEGFGPMLSGSLPVPGKPPKGVLMEPVPKPTQVDEANSLRCSRQPWRRNSAN